MKGPLELESGRVVEWRLGAWLGRFLSNSYRTMYDILSKSYLA